MAKEDPSKKTQGLEKEKGDADELRIHRATSCSAVL